MAQRNSYYITTAIAYPNGVPHIGHAYEAIATDALARFQRLDGRDVFFLTGTDEHGQKMVQTAQKEGMTPHELATRNAGLFREMDDRLNVSYDRFIRTSEEQHHRSSQEIWKRMLANGDIYLDSYAGWYSVRDEAYYAEDETVVGDDQVRRGPQGSPGMDRRGDLLLPAVGLSGQTARTLRPRAGLRAAARTAQRGRELRQGRAAGSVDLAHHLRLGHQGAGRAAPRDVCLDRRADQLHHRRRLSR